MALNPGVQFGIRLSQEVTEICLLTFAECRILLGKETIKKQIQLKQSAPALPAQTTHCLIIHGYQVTRFSRSCLMCPIACEGFSPFGQTSVQFMMV